MPNGFLRLQCTMRKCVRPVTHPAVSAASACRAHPAPATHVIVSRAELRKGYIVGLVGSVASQIEPMEGRNGSPG